MIENKLTDSHWETINNKWSKLLHAISWKIAGDHKADHEDYYNDLILHTIYIINSYSVRYKKEIDEFLEDAGFDKYYKTSIWNYKCTIGKKVKNNYQLNGEFTSRQSLDYLIGFNSNGETFSNFLPDPSYDFGDFEGDDLVSNIDYPEFNKKDRLVMLELMNNPNSYMASTGEINYSEICRNTKLSMYRVQTAIKNIRKEINRY